MFAHYSKTRTEFSYGVPGIVECSLAVSLAPHPLTSVSVTQRILRSVCVLNDPNMLSLTMLCVCVCVNEKYRHKFIVLCSPVLHDPSYLCTALLCHTSAYTHGHV